MLSQPVPHKRHVLLVAIVVNRIGLWHPHDRTVDHFTSSAKADLLEFPGAKREQVGVGTVPQPVAFGAEIFQSQRCTGGFWNHERAPVLEVLNTSQLDR